MPAGFSWLQDAHCIVGAQKDGERIKHTCFKCRPLPILLRVASSWSVTLQSDVIIVGAGCCGLATAIAMAHRGYEVLVLEGRYESPAAGNSATSPWGKHQRNVILDLHSVNHLLALGVNENALPVVQHTTLAQEGGPNLRFEMGSRKPHAELLNHQPEQLLVKRDWYAIAPLGELEQLLYQQLQQIPNARVIFGNEIDDLKTDSDYVTVASSNFRARCRLLVVADGGGRRSLRRRLGIGKQVIRRNHMSFAVVEQTASDPNANDVFAELGTRSGGWYGLFANGRAVSGALRGTRRGGEAEGLLRNLGYTGRLVETPLEIDVQISSAREVSPHKRIVLVGDAASTGDPRSGLGFQMALHSSQCLISHLKQSRPRVARRKYRAACKVNAKHRQAAEQSVLSLVDWIVANPESINGIVAQDSTLATVNHLKLHVSPKSPERLVAELRAEFVATTQPLGRTPLTDVLKYFDGVQLLGNLEFELSTSKQGRVKLTSKISRKHPLQVQLGPHQVTLLDGVVVLARKKAGWQLRLKRPLFRHSIKHVTPTEQRLDSIVLTLPDADMSDLLRLMAREVGKKRNSPVNLSAKLLPGQTVLLGSHRFTNEDCVEFSIEISTQPQRMTLKILSGALVPDSATTLARDAPLNATRWLNVTSGSATLRGVFDGMGRIAASQLRKICLTRWVDGSGTLRFEAPLPLEVSISAAELEALEHQVLDLVNLSNGVQNNLTTLAELNVATQP